MTNLLKDAKGKQVFSAFTLAEVLITLGIIGIVAALTIPTLISNYQKTQYVVGLKKAYSQTNQVLLAMTNDRGTPGDIASSGLFAKGTTTENLGKEFTKYFKIAKDCGMSNNQDCWADKTLDYYDGTSPDIYSAYNLSTSNYKFLTADNMSFELLNFTDWFGSNYADCQQNFAVYEGGTGNLQQVCGELAVDINGRKGPNILGRDTFIFYISNGKGALLYPYGGVDSYDWWGWGFYCSTGATNGYSCAGRVIEDGWQMNY